MARFCRAMLGVCVGILAVGACGHSASNIPSPPGTPGSPTDFHPGGEPGVPPTPIPTPVPVLPGAAVRVLPLNTGARRLLVLGNSAPGAGTAFEVAFNHQKLQTNAYADLVAGNVTDPHVQRLQALQAALVGVAPPAPRYRLALAPREVGSQEPFYVLLDTDPKTRRETQITATLAARGDHCYVWVDPDSAKTPSEKLLLATRVQEIVTTFDSKIYATDTHLFGQEPNPGIDGESRIHILISPAINDYGANSTLGYFSRRDEYPTDPNGIAVLRHSNAKELINMAAGIVLTGSAEDYLGTLAHEFEHMINFNQKVLLPHGHLGEDIWLDEGMAMYALEANGYGLRGGGQVLLGHVRAFEKDPGAYSLSDWEHNPQSIGYGPVYLFTVYLADRFGEGILKEIVTAPSVGFNNLEAKLELHGARFADVFADWATANLLDHLPGAAAPRFSYRMIDMQGTYGGVTLPGFMTTSLTADITKIKLRPCSLLYGDLGQTDTSGISVPAGVELEPTMGLP
jgi:hypothetical protein